MSRKVYIEVEAVVNVAVKVKIPMTIVADEGFNFDKGVKGFLKGKTYDQADLQNALTPEIVAVDAQDHWDDYTSTEDWLQEAVQEKVTAGQVKFLEAKVVDSK